MRAFAYRRLAWIVILILVAQCIHVSGETVDRKEIVQLIRSFEADLREGSDPGKYLSPAVVDDARSKAIQVARKRYVKLRISGYIESDIDFKDATHARLPVHLAWRTPKQSMERTTQINFEKYGGQWYFSDFDFLKFTWLPIIVVLAWIFVAAIVTGLLWYHWKHTEFPNGRSRFVFGTVLFIPILGWFVYWLFRPRPARI